MGGTSCAASRRSAGATGTRSLTIGAPLTGRRSADRAGAERARCQRRQEGLGHHSPEVAGRRGAPDELYFWWIECGGKEGNGWTSAFVVQRVVNTIGPSSEFLTLNSSLLRRFQTTTITQTRLPVKRSLSVFTLSSVPQTLPLLLH
jgi:hypothetical protein